MGKLVVQKSGFLTSIQDAGRHGYRKFGVPKSGAMDGYAHHLSNWLVGNELDAPVLEMTLQGGSFLFKSEARIGLAGGEAEVKLDEETCERYETLSIKAGDVLTIGKLKSGCRIYMAIAGNWKLEKVMGSYSTNLQSGFGGVDGRALQSGDVIVWDDPERSIKAKIVEDSLRPYFGSSYQIRILAGPEWRSLSKGVKEQFLENSFKVSSESNRMGIRLNPKTNIETDLPSMKSAPVVAGTIQIPSNGKPIILMNDAQSVGGYPRIAKVADADLWRLGQVWPPAELSFKMISVEKAIKLSAFQKKLL